MKLNFFFLYKQVKMMILMFLCFFHDILVEENLLMFLNTVASEKKKRDKNIVSFTILLICACVYIIYFALHTLYSLLHLHLLLFLRLFSHSFSSFCYHNNQNLLSLYSMTSVRYDKQLIHFFSLYLIEQKHAILDLYLTSIHQYKEY